MKTFRKYLASSALIAGFLLFGSTALALVAAGKGEQPESLPGVASQTAVAKQDEQRLETAELDDEIAGQANDEAEEAAGPNHGHCVSYWNHQAKDAGLKGKARGEFVSAIAKDEAAVSNKVEDGGTPDSTCDFGDELATALAAQGASDDDGSKGKSGEERGKSAGKGKSGEEHGKSGQEHGKSAGKGQAPS